MINKEKKLKAFERALDVMDRLRAECPWNHAQTIDTLRPMTVEEVYELSDAVMKKDDAALEKELGDVFLHVIFYAKIAEEEGRYDIADVMDKLCEKMIYRHPHVFSTTKVPTPSRSPRTGRCSRLRKKEATSVSFPGFRTRYLRS